MPPATRRSVEEHDELREAVALLVEKVESDGDWRVLHPASLRLAQPADGHVHLGALAAELEDDTVYIQALLASLSNQLESDRRRRQDAEQQVALLSAQVARREAELEARLDPHNDGRSDGAMNMTREAALGLLELTIARNRALEADVKVLEAKLKKRKALAPDRVRSAPPISPARSIRELVPPLRPRPTFLSPHRPSRPRSTPSPPSTPRSPQASTTSPARSPSPLRPRAPSASPPAPPRTPAVVALDAHLHTLEDGVAELHRERQRLAALPTRPATLARVGLLEAECVRLRRRVRGLEQAHALNASAPEEDPDVTIRALPPPPPTAAPPPLPLLPPIDLRPAPTPRPPDQLHRPSSPPPRIRPQDVHEQRLAQLAAELARAQDGVAERERAMEGLRAEIARLRGRDRT